MKLSRRRALHALGGLWALACSSDPPASDADAGDSGATGDSGPPPDASADGGPPGPSVWPLQTTSFVSAIPGVGGYGMDSFGGSGRDGAEGRVTVFLLDDLGTGTVNAPVAGYTRIRAGTLKGFAAVSGPKVLVPVRSGYVNESGELRAGSYCDLYGQFAPGDGLIFRQTIPTSVVTYGTTSAQHQRYWHLDLRTGDDPGGILPSNRDGAYAGSAAQDGYAGGSHNLYVNCAFLWTLDEIVDAYYGLDLASFVYCVFGEPLHESIHDEGGIDSHGYGPILGPGYRWDRLAMQRNLFAHAADRQPMVAALRLALANNLIYDPADTRGNEATVLFLTVDYDAPAPTSTPMLTNWVANMIVRGPSSFAGGVRAIRMTPQLAHPAGSRGCILGNRVDGWTFATQASLLDGGGYPSGWLTSALLAAAWPEGWGAQGEGVRAIGAGDSPNGATPAERRAFAKAIFDTVGPRPGRVHPANRATAIAAQVLAYLDGTTGAGGAVNSVAGTADPSGWPDTAKRFAPNAGGWPTIATVVEDPFAPKAWHAPLPLNGNAPDDRVLKSGTFTNGRSKAGLTAIEAWALEERFRQGAG
jgi:hypothetical protein